VAQSEICTQSIFEFISRILASVLLKTNLKSFPLRPLRFCGLCVSTTYLVSAPVQYIEAVHWLIFVNLENIFSNQKELSIMAAV